MLRFISPIGFALVLSCCGGASRSADTSTQVASDQEPSRWSRSHLRRLDRELRREVISGTLERLAIKVYFRGTPSDDELATLLLSRVGRQIVGNVPRAALHRIAAHAEIDRIETLHDVGY